MKRFVATLAVALSLGAVLTVGVPVLEATTDNSVIEAVAGVDSASAAPTQDCNVARWNSPNGGLVCFDRSERMFHIWAGPYWGSFPSNGGSLISPLGYWTDAQWYPSFGLYHLTYADKPGAFVVTWQDGGADGANNIRVYGGNHDYLEWFAASAGYAFTVVA